MGENNETILANILTQERALVFSNHTNLSPEDCQQKWEQKFARIKTIANLNLSPAPLQMLAGQRSISQPQMLPSKRRKLDNGATQQLGQPCDSTESPQTPIRRQSTMFHERARSSSGRDLSAAATPMKQWLASPEPFNGCNQLEQQAFHMTNNARRPPKLLSVTTYEPSEYCSQEVTLSPLENGNGFRFRRPSINLALSPSLNTPSDFSSSPFSESITSHLDPLTAQTSVAMSRDTSMAGTSFCGDVEHLKLTPSLSQHTSTNDNNFLDSSFSRSSNQVQLRKQSIGTVPLDSRQLLSHTGGVADDKKIRDAFNRQQPELSFIDEGVEAMGRSPSTRTSDSDKPRVSDMFRSQSNSGNRTLIPAIRPIIPSTSESTIGPLSVSSSQSMSRTASHESQNGRVPIAKLPPCERHIPAKAKCDKCNLKPKGYRGEHELRRHHTRAHGEKKTVWICVDKSEGQDFLAGCEQCRTFKKYNAYYNAAAHLRRRHFNAKPRGEKRNRKLKPEEKRGGKGGGTEPPMEELRKWMYDFEVDSEGLPLKEADFFYTKYDSSVATWAQQLQQDEMQYPPEAGFEGFDLAMSPDVNAFPTHNNNMVESSGRRTSVMGSPAALNEHSSPATHASPTASTAHKTATAWNSPQTASSQALPSDDPPLFDNYEYNFDDLMFPPS